MPAFASHYIFAMEMMETLKEISDFKLNDNAVLTGAQGPDIFFFHRALPWQSGKPLRKLGSALHRSNPAVLLDRLYEYCCKTQNADIAKSYALGFILHYSLDRNCHPFVYFLQNKITESNSRFNANSAHNIIEHSIDSIMINNRLGIEKPRLFETAKTIKLTAVELNETAQEIAFLTGISSYDSKTAVTDMKHMQHMLFDKSGKKEKIISVLEQAAAPFTNNFLLSSYFRTDDLEKAQKYVNIENRQWASPFDNKIHSSSFFDLFEKSKKDAEEMILKWQNGADGVKVTNNLSFLTGVEVK